MRNRAPLITAFVLLLLPVLYVGSYFALVNPQFRKRVGTHPNYRVGGDIAVAIFWPLEKLDRKMRWDHWHRDGT